MVDSKKNDALEAEKEYRTTVESAADYIENFDILETITNVGNDEVFTPRKTCDMMLDSLPEEVWHNPNYKWLNPATKNGIFEREIAIRLDIGLKDVIPDTETRRKHILQNMIYAIGQTKFTANVARRTLYYCSQANKKCDEKIVKVSFLRENKNNRAVITVKNTYRNKDVDIEKIFQKGESGKENHFGIGLWEIRNYVRKSNNLDLFTSKDEHFFKQELSVYDL